MRIFPLNFRKLSRRSRQFHFRSSQKGPTFALEFKKQNVEPFKVYNYEKDDEQSDSCHDNDGHRIRNAGKG